MFIDALSILEFFQQHQWILATISCVWAVHVIIGLWKMFTKAGEAGWKALIPVYNFYILMKICWMPHMFWALLGCNIGAGLCYWLALTSGSFWFYIALVLVILAAIIRAVFYYNLSLAYGHGLGYFLGLYLLEPLFMIILGFGSSRYAGNRYLAARGMY